VLSNSKAGIDAYKPPKKKSRVIYNGISPDRFTQLTGPDTIRKTYGINTPYVVLMAASFSPHKDYELFFKVAEYVTRKRNDITFIGVGGYMKDDTQYRDLVNRSKDNNCVLFPGKIKDVESLVNVSDIGVLFSNKKVHGEGISNTIMEYMCLGKPVIANDAGGSREIVFDKCNGYLINDESVEQIGEIVIGLIDDLTTREKFGIEGQRIIYDNFLLDRMGLAFDNVYSGLLKNLLVIFNL
jgi:glycosyltransferase involved in cell wall biosynthesis